MLIGNNFTDDNIKEFKNTQEWFKFCCKAKRLRDSFFGLKKNDGEVVVCCEKTNGNGEAEYLNELLKDKKNHAMFEELYCQDPRLLYKKASMLIDDIESCRVSEQDLDKVEAKICLLLGAIVDAHYENIKVLEKVFDFTDLTYGQLKSLRNSGLISEKLFNELVTNLDRENYQNDRGLSL